MRSLESQLVVALSVLVGYHFVLFGKSIVRFRISYLFMNVNLTLPFNEF